MTILFKTINIQLLTFLRIKQAVFFSFAFPLFLFIVFRTIFGGIGTSPDKDYTIFLLSGIICMTLASDGLFAIGTFIKRYYLNGTLRILRRMPISIIVFITGVVISRFIITITLVFFLNIVSLVIYNSHFLLHDTLSIFTGVFMGLWIFSFLGLCLSFSHIRIGDAEKNVVNLVYFFLLFTSNALYPVDVLNSKIASISNYLPMNPVLSLLRTDEPILIYQLIAWAIIPVILFVFLLNKQKFNR